ncbi:hypothetical protein IFM89_010462 [Coptis chinensis]|uniref:Retrotransposon gag domain-containing protein n=1 Tax=Coptis chinensis TaxID=261450 RepID=A0A835LUG8_9MAGN|nr:hypothetical protein IFM89_010462 [Coptis chinensis]
MTVEDIVARAIRGRSTCNDQIRDLAVMGFQHYPFSDYIRNYRHPTNFKKPNFEMYDEENGDPYTHLFYYRSQMAMENDDALLCNLFPATLKGDALVWFNSLTSKSIRNFPELAKKFVDHYQYNCEIKQDSATLFNLTKNSGESIRDFRKRFQTLLNVNDPPSDQFIIQAFKDAIGYDRSGLYNSLTRQSPFSKFELFDRAEEFARHATLTGSAADHQNGAALEKELPTSKPPTPISVQIAALQALEALLTVGGALRSEGWRSNVDFLLITVATSACEGGWASEERTASLVSGEPTPIWADLQLAALHGILASLLSPTRSRPRYLSQALNPKFPENPFSSAQKHSTPFSRGVLSLEPDPDDDLYESWLGNGDEIVVPISNTDKNTECSEEPSEKHGRQTNVDPLGEQLAADGSISTVVGDEGRNNEHTGSMDVERGVCTDELMVNAERSIVPNVFGGVGNSEVNSERSIVSKEAL